MSKIEFTNNIRRLRFDNNEMIQQELAEKAVEEVTSAEEESAEETLKEKEEQAETSYAEKPEEEKKEQ